MFAAGQPLPAPATTRVMGTTWINAMAASQELHKTFLRLTVENPHQVQTANVADAADALIRRAESGSMVIVDQDIYLQNPIRRRAGGHRAAGGDMGRGELHAVQRRARLRLYSKFYDPPGDRPDWWIIAQFAKRMGFKGYDWPDTESTAWCTACPTR